MKVMVQDTDKIHLCWLLSGIDDLGLGGEDDSLTTGHAGARAGCCIITLLPDPTTEVPIRV